MRVLWRVFVIDGRDVDGIGYSLGYVITDSC